MCCLERDLRFSTERAVRSFDEAACKNHEIFLAAITGNIQVRNDEHEMS